MIDLGKRAEKGHEITLVDLLLREQKNKLLTFCLLQFIYEYILIAQMMLRLGQDSLWKAIIYNKEKHSIGIY